MDRDLNMGGKIVAVMLGTVWGLVILALRSVYAGFFIAAGFQLFTRFLTK